MSNLIERLRDFCEDHIELDYDDVQPIVTEAAQALVEKDIELGRLREKLKGTVTTKYHDDLMYDWQVIIVDKGKEIKHLTACRERLMDEKANLLSAVWKLQAELKQANAVVEAARVAALYIRSSNSYPTLVALREALAELETDDE